MSVIVDGTVKLTYKEFRHFPEDGNRHELIDGEHYMAPAPGTGHQSISRHIQFQLYRQLEETGLAQVFDAPTDVELSETDVVEPDLFLVAAAREDIIKPSRIIGIPDLIVEIISPSTSARDRELKLRLYEKRGVPVYWIVDPVAQVVTTYERDGVEYHETGRHHASVKLRHGTLHADVDLTRVW